MNTIPFGEPRGRGFGFAPFLVQHQNDHPNALAWATFALVLLLVLTVGAMLVARFAARRARHWHGNGPGRRHFAFAGPGSRHDPLDVLRWRYARGEIGRDEFLQGTSDLTARGEAPPPPPEPPAAA
jgi:uncharacterized membrane protein